MGTCDLLNRCKKKEFGEVEFNELSSSTAVKLSRQSGPRPQEEDLHDNSLSRQSILNNASFVAEKSQVINDDPEDFDFEANKDVKNTSLDETEQTVEPTIINKKKLATYKVKHSAKKNIMPGFKGIMRNQFGKK